MERESRAQASMSDLKDYLLVCLSSSFSNRALLEAKLRNYTAELEIGAVIIVNDVRGLLERYFGDAIVRKVPLSAPLGERRRLVENAKWVVLFWDGTGIGDYLYFSSLNSKRIKVIPFASTRVVNKDRGDEFELYIGRGTPWGNPFAISDALSREQVIEMYREYFQKKFIDDEEGNRAIKSLRGRILGCHCKPAACHGDVIAEYLNNLSDGEELKP